MLYAAYEAQRVTLDGARAASRAALDSLDLLPSPIADLDPVRRLRAAHQVFIDSAITHERLPFGIDKVGVETPAGVRAVAVQEQVVTPLSGHFATLLTDTVRMLLSDHDVHVTDWHNARDVGLEHGPFGLDE